MRKRHVWASIALVIPLFIAGCGSPGDSSVAESSPSQDDSVSIAETASPTRTPTPSPTYSLPEVDGLTVGEAIKVFKAESIDTDVELDLPHGLSTLSVNVPKSVSDHFEVRLARENLGSGSKISATIFAEPTQELADKHFSWLFECSSGRYEDDPVEGSFYSLESIWSSKDFKNFEECEAEFLGDKWKPTKVEKTVEAQAQKHWEGDEEPVLAFGAALEYCTVPAAPSADNPLDGWGANMALTMIKGSVKLCPEAPFYDEMKSWADGEKIVYGTYDVGIDMKPGTYRSSKNISDCYSERMTGSGETIANDFISHASKGAIVIVRDGETFEADKNCGIWTRQV